MGFFNNKKEKSSYVPPVNCPAGKKVCEPQNCFANSLVIREKSVDFSDNFLEDEKAFEGNEEIIKCAAFKYAEKITKAQNL